jgi:hypothetical protein
MNKRRQRLTDDEPLGANGSLDLINIHVAIFGIFLSLTFAYFVYFSYQLTEIQSDMVSKIYEINSINVPYPWQFLSVAGHKNYFYTERREALREEFSQLERQLEVPNLSDDELKRLGSDTQRVITQIAYFFPYKKMLEFNKDGSAVFNPNNHNSIDVSAPVNTEFLKQQVDEIYNWNYSFTLKLRDSKDRIARAMILSNGIDDDYTKSRLTKYLDSLIEYLSKHYELAVPLGLTIKKYDYIQEKIGKSNLALLIGLLVVNFTTGILVPMFWKVRKRGTVVEVVFLSSFIFGSIILFKEALYSISY